jgi:hypothetical protein
MASDAVTIEGVLREALAPFGASPVAGLAKQMDHLAAQLAGLDGEVSLTREMIGAKGSGERSASVGGVVTGIGVGLGVPALIGGIRRLFGSGDEGKELPPLVEFAWSAPVRVNAGVSERIPGGPFFIDAAQGGVPRPRTSVAVPTNITVQVQAMDSRSFLDHSGDIARAVRQAMLESSVLNDVIREV